MRASFALGRGLGECWRETSDKSSMGMTLSRAVIIFSLKMSLLDAYVHFPVLHSFLSSHR